MAATFDSIMRNLKARKYDPIYFLQGEESFFIDTICDEIEENVLEDQQKSFNQLILYGKDTSIESVVQTSRRFPMMSDLQVVILKEAQHLKEINKLASYVDAPLKSTILVVSYKGKSLNGNTKLAKALKKKDALFTAKKLYDNQVPSWVQNYLKQRGYSIDGEALHLISEYLGANLGKIANELDKLFLNIPDGTAINKNHISDNIGISKEYNLFELQKALSAFEREKAFKIVKYFSQNPKAAPLVVISGSLFRFFSRLYVYHDVKNKNTFEQLQAMGMRENQQFFLREYQMAAKFYSVSKTKRNLSLLFEYDLKAKGVNNPATPENELMKEMVFRLMA